MASFKQLLRASRDPEDAVKVSYASALIQQRRMDFSCGLPPRSDQIEVSFQTESIKEIRAITDGWSNSRQTAYAIQYGNILQMIQLPVDKSMVRAAMHFWDSRRRCFVFNGIDMVPTIEEYRRLLGLPKLRKAEIFKPNPQKSCKQGFARFIGRDGFNKEALGSVIIQNQKEVIPWEFIKQAMNGATEDPTHSYVTLAIYGLVVFPRLPDFIDGDIFNFVKQVIEGADPTPAILAETIRSLSYLQTNGVGKFMGCLPLLSTWLKSHFPCVAPRFKEVYSWPPTPILDILRSRWDLCKNFVEWKTTFSRLEEADIIWMAPWMPYSHMIFSAGSYDWVPLLGPRGGTSYAPLQVGRQLGNHQIIPILHGMERCDIQYGIGKSESIMSCMFRAWGELRIMKVHSNLPDVSLAYSRWRQKLEYNALMKENLELRALNEGQEDAIKRLTERIRKREQQLEAVIKRRRSQGDEGPETGGVMEEEPGSSMNP